MNDTLKQFARQQIKDGLNKLPIDHHRIFKLMYGRGGYTPGTTTRTAEEAEVLPIHQVVDEIPAEKLDWAMQQVDNSLRKIAKDTVLA
jgi:hypothetical protein